MGLQLITGPAGLAVDLAAAKLHLRIDDASEDANVSRLIEAATSHVQQMTGRALVSQRWRLLLDSFPGGAIRVPMPPLQSVEAVTYIDAAGQVQTLAASDYTVDPSGLYGLIWPAFGKTWPSAQARPMSVSVEFTAGYGDAADVPADLQAALLLLVGHYDQNREAVVVGTISGELPRGVAALLAPYTIPGVA